MYFWVFAYFIMYVPHGIAQLESTIVCIFGIYELPVECLCGIKNIYNYMNICEHGYSIWIVQTWKYILIVMIASIDFSVE